jgi:hypothetical protein
VTVLEEIRSSGDGAHGSLDEAQTMVKRASEEAGDPAQSAAAQAWAGVAQTMESAQEALDAADAAIGTITQALAKLSEITDQMSSNEVASRLATIKRPVRHRSHQHRASHRPTGRGTHRGGASRRRESVPTRCRGLHPAGAVQRHNTQHPA